MRKEEKGMGRERKKDVDGEKRKRNVDEERGKEMLIGRRE